MTSSDGSTFPRSPKLETEEQLRARINELEAQLDDARSAYNAEARIGRTTLAALALGLLVSAPMAMVTLKRWITWWRE